MSHREPVSTTELPLSAASFVPPAFSKNGPMNGSVLATATGGSADGASAPGPTAYILSLEERLKARKRKKEYEKLAAISRIGSDDPGPGIGLTRFADDSTASAVATWPKQGSPKNSETLKDGGRNDTPIMANVESTSRPTIATSPGPIPLPLPTQPAVKLPSNEPSESTKESGKEVLGEFVAGIFSKMKNLIGFTPDCLNGGSKRLGGKCFCPQYFEGELCEKRLCLNNSTLVRIKTIPKEEMCKCPHPEFITGKHCETIHCQNGGRPLPNGSCKCIDNWYTGQFCEYYAASWFAVLGIPLICIAVIALCCVICRLDFCPKRSSPHRENRRRNRHLPDSRRYRQEREHRRPHQFDDPQTLMIHENLLNDCHQQFHRNGQIRLENIPVYNPQLHSISNDEFKPLEPPPSYEQAVSSCQSLAPLPPQRPPHYESNVRSGGIGIPPPPAFDPPRRPPSHHDSAG